MERSFVCGNGHSFKLFDEREELSPQNFSDVSFAVHCPICSAITDVSWPSNHAFKVAAT
jgi:hypothetical protein